MRIPLLIGGATTSRQHTAVKIAPAYSEGVAHVLDASRAGGRRRPAARPGAARGLPGRGARATRRRCASSTRPVASGRCAPARRGAPSGARASTGAPRTCRSPSSPGAASCAGIPLAEHRPVHRLDLLLPRLGGAGQVPRRPRPPAPRRGRARALRQRPGACSPSWPPATPLRANAAYGLWPANSEGDDIVLYADAARAARGRPLPHAAPAAREGRRTSPSTRSPTSSRRGSPGLLDHVGGFAVTAGIGADELAAAHEASHDDYSAIMVKALADRLAEALAEMLHARVRREWGYGRDEALSNEELIAEAYRGHPPRLRLPGLPRPPAQAPPVRPARRGGGRDEPHRARSRCCRRPP